MLGGMTPWLVALSLALPAVAQTTSTPAYKDPAAAVEDRVSDLLGRMTLDEKVAMLSGDDMDLKGNPRLGIPTLKMTDGPLGVRFEKATAFPAGISMGSTFDPALVARAAAAMGVETLALGKDMLLGPCINIARSPLGGRDFESFGEDPFLAARLGAAYVTALQDKKVISSTKHYALNNEEVDRMTVDVKADERAMHELYLPAFLAAVRAGTWTVMAAYNKVNGSYASENDYLLNEVLKERWGFTGLVVSDWGATHSTVGAANGGLDLEMPSGDFFGGGKLQEAVKAGQVPLEAIDDKARRILRVMFTAGLFERTDADRPPKSAVNGPEHQAIALELAQEGTVLLKNEGVLPLDTAKAKTVALIGPSAAEARPSGGGSSEVVPFYAISPMEGLKERAPELKLLFAQGARMPGGLETVAAEELAPPEGKGTGHGLFGEYFANKDLSGVPAFTRLDPQVDFEWASDTADARLGGLGPFDYSIRWSGSLRVKKSATYELAVRSDDGARLWVDGSLLLDHWVSQPPTTYSVPLELESGKDHALRLEYYQARGGAMVRLGWVPRPGADVKEASAAAGQADAALVFVGVSDQMESEGHDRDSLSLPPGQDELIEAVAKANKNTVVVIQAGTPVAMPWADRVKGIVEAWYPGQEGGRAIADLLLGRVNPSGRLPISFPKRWEDSAAYGHFPGGKDGVVDYAEGLLVGYRWFDAKKLEPLFPFGHGLSFTTFAYSALKVETANAKVARPDVSVSVDVKNTGGRAGTEVVQLYVHDDAPPVERPDQELKGFERVPLAPGETKTVSFKLGRDAFAHYDPKLHAWVLPPGRFTARMGASSRDIRQTGSIELQ